jgi:hypothetical protein
MLKTEEQRGGVTLYITDTEPAKTVYVNPADDPGKR